MSERTCTKTGSPFRVNPYAAQSHVSDEHLAEFHQCQVLQLVLWMIVLEFFVSAVFVVTAVMTTNAWLQNQGIYGFGDMQLDWKYDYLIALTWLVPAVLLTAAYFASVTRLKSLQVEIRRLQLGPDQKEASNES